MSEKVATNAVASRPPERRLIGTLTACANKENPPFARVCVYSFLMG